MSAVALARWQFAITTVYHFFFVPLTLGLSIFVAIMETIYVLSGNEIYKRMAKFWGKLFLINFAMGVVTGIVQEFQFGMNWSQYSRFVGDIFGAPLAIEALLAFFLESTFLGVWVFGWDRLSKKAHAAVIWLVAIGSNLSALWILIANSFMQEPVGFVLRNGRAEMTDFLALITNENIWVQFPHVLTAGLTTAAFFIIGISAYHLVRKAHVEVFSRSFQIGAVIGFVAVVLVIVNGHSQAKHMVRTQPMKMASAEALWETEDPASFSLLTIGDLSMRREVFSIRVPRLLSLLAYNKFSGAVRGINDIQAEYEQKYGPDNYVPPVMITYWTFRLMVGAGFLMLLIAIYGVYKALAENYDITPKVGKYLVWGIALPYIGNSMGWIFTEVGRQPWVVFGLMKTKDAVSNTVAPGLVLLTVVLFTAVYGVLMVADVFLLKKYAKLGPEEA